MGEAALRGSSLLLSLCLLALAGCGSGQQTITISSTPPAAEPSTQTATAATPTANYPVVHWNDNPWPFTLQLVSITKSGEGFLSAAPPGLDWLMVRINITSQTSDRTPPTPELQLLCTGPNSAEWNPNDSHIPSSMYSGYEQEPGSNHLVLGTSVGLGYGVTETYGAEWEVPENTNTSEVTCGIDSLGTLLKLN